MLIDLQTCATPVICRRCDVVVIGAGIAGLLLATNLARRGIEVLVLESGSNRTESSNSLNIVEQVGQPYHGAIYGRSRGVGGTSRLWGGAMLPFQPCDMETHTAGWPVEWPVTYSEVEPAFAEIERTFGLPTGTYNSVEAEHGKDADFVTRSAKWPAFRQRNIANVLSHEIGGRTIQIWINATVTTLSLGENGRVRRAIARSFNGNRLDVEGGEIIVAAGAIESTRLLLLLDDHYNERIFKPDRQLGYRFFDHLSTTAATIRPPDEARLNRTFGLRFERGGMRDQRLEPSPALRRKYRLPAAFAHVAAISDKSSGFNALRGAYRSVQSRSGMSFQQVRDLARDIPWLIQAGYWRFQQGRLLYPRNASYHLVLVTEQNPNPRNSIKLSRTSLDYYGMPRALIDWRTDDVDIDAFAALQSHLCAYWNASPLAEIASITPIPHKQWQSRLQNDSGVYHPGGTTRMGRSVSTGVVDSDLRAFRVPNLTIVSTSCFPTGGGTNPTFMLMAFALRVADRIFAERRKGAINVTNVSTSNTSHAG